jgi:hypothetical protein
MRAKIHGGGGPLQPSTQRIVNRLTVPMTNEQTAIHDDAEATA